MTNNKEYLDKLFSSNSFKKDMDINIKQILIDRPMNCSFEFKSNEKECYTDGKRIVIGKLDELRDLDDISTYALIKALVGHEASHIKWSNFNDLKSFNDKAIELGYEPSLALSIANILEDGRIERLLCNYLKGFSKYIHYLNLILIYKDGKIESSDNLLFNIINTMLFLAKLGIYPDNFNDIFSKEEQRIIQKYLEPKMLTSLKAPTHKEVLDTSIEILDILSSKFDNLNINKEDTSLTSLLENKKNPGYNTSEGEDCREDISLDDIDANYNSSSPFEMDLNTSKSDTNSSNDLSKNTIDELGDEVDTNGLNSSIDNKSTTLSSDNDDAKDDSSIGMDYTDNSISSGINNQDGTNKPFKTDLNACNDDISSDDNLEDSSSKVDNCRDASFSDNNNAQKNEIGSFKTSLTDTNKSLNDFAQDMLEELRESIKTELDDIKQSMDWNDNSSNSKDSLENLDLNSINEKYKSYRLKEEDFKYEYINAPYTPYPSEFMSDIKILEKQFKNLLKNEDEFIKKQKRGRIDSSNLWKINTIYDNNIFSKKTIQNDSDYAVYILIDLSGSMNTRLKYNQAISTAIKIEGALINLPGVKVKTVGFDYTYYSRLRVFKDFNDKKSKTANALYSNYTGDSNRDGFAIRVALEDLKKTNAKNTLLILISDGRPAWDGERIEDAMNDVKDAVHNGRKQSLIMSVLINEGQIYPHIKDAFYFMYEDKGTIMADIKKEPEILLSSIVLYLKKLFKKR